MASLQHAPVNMKGIEKDNLIRIRVCGRVAEGERESERERVLERVCESVRESECVCCGRRCGRTGRSTRGRASEWNQLCVFESAVVNHSLPDYGEHHHESRT